MKWIPAITLIIIGTAWGIAVDWWLQPDAGATFDKRRPVAANVPRDVDGATLDLRGEFISFIQPQPKPTASSTLSSEPWPMFRGANHDNIYAGSVALAETWPGGKPPVAWSLDLGEGYAGPAIINGRMYLLDYLEAEYKDSLRCFSVADGRELWRRSYPIKVKRNHGISRTVPATDGAYVVSLGPKCHVLCVDAINGAFKWGLDLVREYGTKVPLWYAGQCPVINDGKAILAPGGTDTLMMAVDCETGEIAWEVPNTFGWKMSHSSIIPMTLLGQAMYVCFYQGGAVGVSLDGALLWSTDLWDYAVVAPSPVQTGPDRLVITSGYGAGSMELIVKNVGATMEVAAGRRWTKSEFACEQQTPVLFKDHLYTVMPKDAGERRERLVCMALDGTFKWMSSDGRRFGLGPYLVADDKILVLNDEGVLTMARATPDDYIEVFRADVLDGHDAWAPMALVDGRLIVRDLNRMICLDLRKEVAK